MYTQCPNCLSIYQVTPVALQQSHGKFRCGYCGTVFDALPSLTEHLPEVARGAELPRAYDPSLPAVLSEPVIAEPRPDLGLDDSDGVQPELRSYRPPPEFDFLSFSALDDDDFGSQIVPKTRAESTSDYDDRKEPMLPADWMVYTPGQTHAQPLEEEPKLVSYRPNNLPNGSNEQVSVQPTLETRSNRAVYKLPGEELASANPKDHSEPSRQDRYSKPSAQTASAQRSTELAQRQFGIPSDLRGRETPQPAPTPAEKKSSPSRGIWIAASLLLSLLLLGQLAWYQRTSLLAHRDFRPWLDRACALAGCQLPLRVDLENFVLVDRDVKPHPRVKGALLISASLKNAAAFAQNYPIVEVRLSNIGRQTIAMRRFAPINYLRDAAVIADGIPADASLPIIFEVLDPGPRAVNFEFEFLPGPELES
jgi:predicted Zn finger-like uncharacterized protein